MTRRLSRLLMLVAATLLAGGTSSVTFAQGQPVPGRPGAVGPRRQQLEERLRQRTGEVVRRQLQLNDDQMSKLHAANRQFESQRAQLMMRERELRRDLRQQILSGYSANQARVAQLLDQTIAIQRQRLDLVQAEQRELAKFLSPVQRAKYFGLQGEFRSRAQELRGRAMHGGPNRPGARRTPRPGVNRPGVNRPGVNRPDGPRRFN